MERISNLSILKSLMLMAETWAQSRSKGNTKVGAVVYRQHTGEAFYGYNGFPVGIPDLQQWWDNSDSHVGITRHDLIIHAEDNAVTKAIAALGLDLSECILVCTMKPCVACLRHRIIPTGIRSVYYKTETADMLTKRELLIIDKLCRYGNIAMQVLV